MYTVVVRHQNGSIISENEIHTDYYHAPHKKLQSATLELEENTAGTFTFTVPKGQMGNNGNLDIDIKSDEVIVFQNPDVRPDAPTGRGKEIWRGFFLENNTEFFNSKTFTCIGELAYLNETVQKDATYKFEGDNEYPEKVFKALLGIHNAKVPEKKQFLPGTVTVKADNTAAHLVNKVQTDEFSTTYSDHTFDCIKKLIDSCGGYLKVRRENGTRYLDWLMTYESNGQTINFGKNLLDYAVEQDVTDLITVLYPFGESVSQEVDDGQGGTTTKRSKVNISTATGQNGRLFVTLNDTGSYSPDPMTELGWREGTVDFPNVRDPNNLKRLAINYLKNQWDPDLKLYTKIQIKAVDLAYFTDEDADPIEFLQSVKVTSTPHGITNKVVPVTKMTIPLLQPEQTIYTMSTAMRKTKQISTSVTDHDKDIEKTQDTVDDIGGGEEDEGAGEVVIEGKDPTDDWVIGKPTVGKKPSEEGDSDYLKHQKHLKVWYDMAGAVDLNGWGFVSNWTWRKEGEAWFNPAGPLYGDRGVGYMHTTLEDSTDGNITPFHIRDANQTPRDGDYNASSKYAIGGEHGGSAGWYPNLRSADVRTGTDDSNIYNIEYYQDGEFAGGPGSLWRPSFISDDLKEGSGYIDDKESHTFKDGTNNRTITHGYADIHGDMPINIYFKEEWDLMCSRVSTRASWPAMNLWKRQTWWFDRCVKLNEPQSLGWANLNWTTEERTQNPYNPDPNIGEENRLLVGTPLADTVSRFYEANVSWDSMVSKVKGWQKQYSRYSAGRVFNPKVSGVMPILQRPLQSNAQSIVIYAVADFCYGVNADRQWLSGISSKTVGFGGRDKNPNTTNAVVPPEFDRRLCRFQTGGSDPEGTLPIGLYRLDLITDGPEGYAGTPMALMPCGKWWAYAWVLNVGAGEKYPVTSDLTGGLFVCNSSGLIWTGHAKWTSDYNAALPSSQEDPRVNYKQFAHFPEFNKASNAKDQRIFINGVPGTLRTSKTMPQGSPPEGEEDPRNYDRQGGRQYDGRIGHYQNLTGSKILENNGMGLKAIGYCRAAYQQITVDEVVDNLNYLFNKYCKA